MNLITVSGLKAAYGQRTILTDVSFSAAPGEIIGVLGANGSGKTTLLKSICGIIPCEGQILLDGKELKRLRPTSIARLCAYVPQRSSITLDLSVQDVVLMAFNPQLPLLGRPTQRMQEAALAALERVGLADRAQDSFLALSEGQKQLCTLARAFASDAPLLMLDEPENALDLQARQRVQTLLRDWCRQGHGALMALHDPSIALNGCDRLLLLAQGRLIDTLTPAQDSDARMSKILSSLYGAVTVTRAMDNGGREHLVLLKDN